MNIEFTLLVDPEKATPTHPDFKGRGTVDGTPFIGSAFKRKDPVNKTPMLRLRLNGTGNSKRYLGRLHLSSDGQCSGTVDTDVGSVNLEGVCNERTVTFNSVEREVYSDTADDNAQDTPGQQVRYTEDVVVKDVPGDALLKLSALAAQHDTSVSDIARDMMIDLADNMD